MRRTLGFIMPVLLTVPVAAADYFGAAPALRPAYPDNWQVTDEGSLSFEMGLAYWLSKGGQKLEFSGESVQTDDTSHILEAHFRIEDAFTSSYLKGVGGYAIAIDGDYSTSVLPGEASFSGGQIGHVGADFGYMPFGNDQFRIGGLIGYQFMRESPDKARFDLLEIDALNIHAMRLGLTAKVELGTHADLTAELAGIPYANVSGSTPDYVTSTEIGGVEYDRLRGTIDSAAYGASAELMLGLHPSENMTIRLGGKGWILNGPTTADVTYTNDSSTYYTSGVVLDGLPIFRYGLMAELVGRF